MFSLTIMHDDPMRTYPDLRVVPTKRSQRPPASTMSTVPESKRATAVSAESLRIIRETARTARHWRLLPSSEAWHYREKTRLWRTKTPW